MAQSHKNSFFTLQKKVSKKLNHIYQANVNNNINGNTHTHTHTNITLTVLDTVFQR